jgi:hypothetical protein
MADVFDKRLEDSLTNLKTSHATQIDVPPDRQFIGLDGFRKAIDSLSPGDVERDRSMREVMPHRDHGRMACESGRQITRTKLSHRSCNSPQAWPKWN